MLQIITNPYTIDKLNKNLAFCATYKKKELLDLSYYARDNISNYDTIEEIPQENLNYLQNGLYVSNMNHMFYGCMCLMTIPKLNINTSQCTNMSGMFYYCYSLTSLNISNWDTSNTIYTDNMFKNCTDLTEIQGIIDMKNCKSYSEMFYNCSSLKGVKIKNPPDGFDGAGLISSQYEIVS